MRGFKLLFLFAIFLLFAIPFVQAGYDPFEDPFNPYQAPDITKVFPYTALSDPLAPKIDCHPDGLHCLMLVYENNTFYGRGVKIWYSTKWLHPSDIFKYVFSRTQVGSFNVDYTSYDLSDKNIGLPYDVVWDSSISKYRIIIGQAGSTQLYTYGSDGLVNLGTHSVSGVGFINKNSYASMINEILTFDAGVTYRCYVTLQSTNFDTGSSGTITRNAVGGTCGASGGTPASTSKPEGTILTDYEGTYEYYIVGYGYCTMGGACGIYQGATTFDSVSSDFPTNFTGLDYWDGTFVLYQQNHTGSWEVGTTDLANYGSPNLVHDWTSLNNYFNWTDTALMNTDRIWAWQKIRKTGDPTISQGIFVTHLPLTTIRVWGEGYDIENKKTDIVNISVTINSTNVSGTGDDYVQTVSGMFPEIQTPSETNNEILITSFDYQPNLVRFENLTIPSNCWGLTNYIRTTSGKGFYKPYDFTVVVRDEFFGSVINGATVLLGSDEETTDVTGKAIFYDIFPIENPNMTIGSYEDYPDCTQYYTFTGSEKIYTLVANKDGYETETDTFKIATSPFDVDTDFIDEKTVYLTPDNTRVEIFVYSKDGIELSPSFVTVNITSGSNDTYWILNNEWYHQTYARSVPALFYLLNNTGTFDITIELKYIDTYNTTTEVTVGSYHKVDFYLPYSSWELPCYSDGDCENILCIGKFYKKLKGCISNVCEYQTIDCGSETNCDLNIGCVDLISLTNCTKDQDCPNYCLDSYTMVDYKCGHDGFCKGVYVDCPDFCNQTLGYCNKYRNCILGQTQEFKVGFYRDGHFVGTSDTLKCDFSNAESYQCFNPNGYEIEKDQLEYWGLDFNDVRATPKGWKAEYGQDGNSLIFYAVSVYCNDECNITWEYCPNGCAEDGQCKGIEDVLEDTYGYTVTLNDFWTGFVIVYNDIFPDIHSRSFLWFVYAIIIYLSLWWFKMKALPQRVTQISVGSHHEGDIIMFLIWFAIGSVFGQFYWFVWFGITILAVYLFANFWIKRHGGKE